MPNDQINQFPLITNNPLPLIQHTIEAHLDFESRCESEREGSPRFCSACQHLHEAVDGECPYMEGLEGPML